MLLVVKISCIGPYSRYVEARKSGANRCFPAAGRQGFGAVSDHSGDTAVHVCANEVLKIAFSCSILAGEMAATAIVVPSNNLFISDHG